MREKKDRRTGRQVRERSVKIERGNFGLHFIFRLFVSSKPHSYPPTDARSTRDSGIGAAQETGIGTGTDTDAEMRGKQSSNHTHSNQSEQLGNDKYSWLAKPATYRSRLAKPATYRSRLAKPATYRSASGIMPECRLVYFCIPYT